MDNRNCIYGGVHLYIHSFTHSLKAFSKRILTAKLAADCAEWSLITKNTSLCFSIVAKIFAERSFPVWGVLDFLLFLRWLAFDLFDFLAFFWPFFLPSGPASLSSWSEKIWGKKTHTHWQSDLTSRQEISDFVSDGKMWPMSAEHSPILWKKVAVNTDCQFQNTPLPVKQMVITTQLHQ